MVTIMAMSGALATILWIVAVVLVISGIVALTGGEVLTGAVLIIWACWSDPAE